MTATQSALIDLLAAAGIDRGLLNDAPDGDTVVVDRGEDKGAIVVGFDDDLSQEWVDYTVYDAEHTIERTDGAESHRAANDVAKLIGAR